MTTEGQRTPAELIKMLAQFPLSQSSAGGSSGGCFEQAQVLRLLLKSNLRIVEINLQKSAERGRLNNRSKSKSIQAAMNTVIVH